MLKKKHIIFFLLLIGHALGWGTCVLAQDIFKVDKPNYSLSPATGLDRRHWTDAAKYLLSGAFAHLKTLDDPMVFPKLEGKSYPKDGKHTATEMLEGLCRTLFIAAPLLKEEPDLVLNNIKVADYYRHQLKLMVNATSPTYIPLRPENGGPSQILVEFGGLSISLFTAPEILWDPLSNDLKQKLAKTMLSYGEGPTIDMNWRFFNIFILSFYKKQGFEINKTKLEGLIDNVLGDYVGQGWYNDSPYYDYYSMWAFQMYGVLWSQFFGKEYYPEYSQKFMSNLSDLVETYPFMFGEDGRMIMWGRSITYRMGAAAPFPLMGLLENKGQINYGWLRRIASGTLLQFLENPNFLDGGIPSLGFYGHFEPAIQPYSCRGSSFWLGKIFLTGLLIPKDNIFWTAKENNGEWNKKIKSEGVSNRYFEGSHILITDYSDIGAAEIRAWCNSKDIGFYQGTENYNKLAYNSAFPWQADGQDGIVSMNYSISKTGKDWETLRMYNFKGYDKGGYRRQAKVASDTTINFSLNDRPLVNGILRVDTVLNAMNAEIHLGHYALNEYENKPIREYRKRLGKFDISIIDNGKYQLAFVPLEGWDNVQSITCKGLHPVSKTSKVLQGSVKSSNNRVILKTLLLWKKSGEAWNLNDLKY